MSNYIISLNDGTQKRCINEVRDTHYTKIKDDKTNSIITITGTRSLLRGYLDVKSVFSPILITPFHRVYLSRFNS